MAKKITGYIKLQVAAGKANPAPPIGTALGPKGLNIMEFCKAFNAKTQKIEPGTPIPVVITVYADKSFTFETKTPPNTHYIKQYANIKSGAKKPGLETAGTISRADLVKIAELKIKDTNAGDVESVVKMLEGSARSMGIEVKG